MKKQKSQSKTKITAFMMALIMMLALLPSLSLPASALTFGDWEYIVSASGATVTITHYTGSDLNVVIPSTIPAGTPRVPTPVTAIGSGAFMNCASITSVTIPNGIISIEHNAFSGCTSLTAITIPGSVIYIGGGAFWGCSSLVDAYFKHADASAITAFGPNVFEHTDPNFKITYPAASAGFTTPVWQGYPAFPEGGSTAGGAPSIEHISLYPLTGEIGATITVTVTGIKNTDKIEIILVSGDHTETVVTYKNNPAGTETFSVRLTDSNIIKIRAKAYGAAGTHPAQKDADITMSDSDWEFTILNEQATITKYKGKNTVVSVPDAIGAFPVTAIGNNAFGAEVTTVIISGGVSTIAKNAFAYCRNLTMINAHFSNAHFFSENGVLFSKDKTVLYIYPAGKSGNYTIPSGVKSIDESAFSACQNLTGVTIPDSVTAIGSSAFANCPRLSAAYFKHSDAGKITSFGSGVFQNAASDFRIIYPADAKGFTTPKWKDYPAEPEKPDKPDNQKIAEEAAGNVEKHIKKMTAAEKTSSEAIDRATLFAEDEILKSASKNVSGGTITVNQAQMQDLQKQAALAKELIENVFEKSDIDLAREIRVGARLIVENNKNAITFQSSLSNTALDMIEINAPGYAVSMSKESIKDNTRQGNFTITIEEIDTPASVSSVSVSTGSGILLHDLNKQLYYGGGKSDKSNKSDKIFAQGNNYIANSSKGKSYQVVLSKPANSDFKVILDPADGDTAYQAVVKPDNTAVWSKYNPMTKKVEARIRESNTYTVKENKINFGDVSKKSAEMQKAITVLASKSIIKGTSQTTFSPDQTINRAELTALIIRIISQVDPNADGKFDDVKKNDWFFGEVSSAKNKGIVQGKSATMFHPYDTISKVEIIAISARTLRSEMKYKDTKNQDTYLNKYGDRSDLPDWCLKEVSLATRENLIVQRTDGKFNPNTSMTRGDAAIVLYRLFEKIW